MRKYKRILSLFVAFAVCCSSLITFASAAYIASAGTKTGARCSYDSSIDYDIYGSIKYEYFGEDTSTSYDYVIDVTSLSAYITNRGRTLSGVGYVVDCNSNYIEREVPQSIPTNSSWVHSTVYIGTYGGNTMFRFNSEEAVAFSIGALVPLATLNEELVFVGWLHTLWRSSGTSTTWYGT